MGVHNQKDKGSNLHPHAANKLTNSLAKMLHMLGKQPAGGDSGRTHVGACRSQGSPASQSSQTLNTGLVRDKVSKMKVAGKT